MTRKKELIGRKRKPTAEYAVGYCKPPVATRWKKGLSGNPGGRKPKPRYANDGSFADFLQDELHNSMKASSGGREVSLPFMQMLAKFIVADMANGTPSHRRLMVKMFLDMGYLAPRPASRRNDPEALQKFVAELAASASHLDDWPGPGSSIPGVS